MAEVIINRFEVIQIDKTDSQQRLITFAVHNRLTEAISEQGSVRQGGEHIVVCHHAELFLLLLTTGDV